MSRVKQLLIALVALLLAAPAPAQVGGGTITGIVTDSSGGVITDVSITITNEGTGVANRVTTNSAGVYTVPNLAPARYRLAAEKQGFKIHEERSVLVQVGETARLDFALTIGSATETVQVTGQAPLLKRDTSDTGTAVTSQEVEELPLTSFGDQRTPATFIQLAPGTTGHGNSDGGPGANRTMTTSVSGSMVSSTTMLLDGADVVSAGAFEGDLRALQIPPDAIQEFKLESTNGSAEYGRSGGGAASFQVKSGTNQIHGEAYEFLRNDALNARNFFQPSVTKYKQNEFGANAGGPIRKDRAFIFGYYDGFRLTQGVSSGLATIPTEQMKQGDFTNYGTTDPTTGVFTMTPLYDPTTHTTCGPEICGNKVNPQYFDPVAVKVIPLMPTPSNSDPRAVVNNFTSSASNPLSVNEWGLKGDYVVNEKNRLSVTYAYGKNSTPNIPLIPAPLGGGDQPSVNLTRNIRLNYNLILRPNLINQATASLNQWNSGTQAVSTWAGKSDWVSYLGIKGIAANYPTEFPQIVINGQSWNGGGGASLDNQHSTGLSDTLAWIRGRHTAKFGFQYLKGADNAVSTGNSAGYFNFLNQETGLSGNPNTGIAFASFLLGLADEGREYHFNAPAYSRNSYYAAFAQDDFKITSRLTLNVGLRWDLFTPVVHLNNAKSWVNPTLPNPDLTPDKILGVFQTATSSNRSGMNTYYKDFSPRVGLAYSLNDKTVIRAAYGIFYAQGNGNRVDGTATVQGYNGTVGSTSPDSGITPGFILGQDTLPNFTPDLSPTAFLGGGTPRHSAGTLIMIDPTDGLSPYNQNYTLDIERQLPSNTVLSVAFVGNKGTHLASRLTPWDKMPPQYLPLGNTLVCGDVVCPANPDPSLNPTSLLFVPIGNPVAQAAAPIAAMPVDPATGHHSPFAGFENGIPSAGFAGYGSSGTVGQALRINPQYAGLHRYYEGLGVSDYDALQVKLDKRFSNGLTLLVSYAWSKTLTDGGSIFSTFSSEFATTTPWNRKAQKAYSFEDIPNRLSVAYVYDLPVGKGKRFLNQGGALNQVVGGWKTSGILTYESGRPQNIEVADTTGALENNGWREPDRVNGVPMASAAYHSGHFDPAKDSMFNPAAFAIPCQFCFGTLTPTEATVRDFPWPNEDLSLMKEWELKESWQMTFHADFFNVFNRVVFGDNNGAYATEPTFGQPGFGMLGAQVNNPRVIQFGLNLKW